MTQEEKQLLLQDLCARLPYGVKYKTYLGDVFTLKDITFSKTTTEYYIDDNAFSVYQIKPFLRPLSSMTEEEKKEIQLLKLNLEASSTDVVPKLSRNMFWYYEHHFDVNGLIPIGLALEAPEGMYKT